MDQIKQLVPVAAAALPSFEFLMKPSSVGTKRFDKLVPTFFGSVQPVNSILTDEGELPNWKQTGKGGGKKSDSV
ncbi:hypothetical protein PGT21_004276 [Puccinia graminis f. sp. tritici]|uniref:Uncharacterized protein n=1 Tax=Puccinia graminis f. sp. tritici TaxID=56615 RepID=A0A5B0Q201_PUCGR|nr:hypothetical protein PGT21_004276 [Puccinia graminis f. sp. tritici]